VTTVRYMSVVSLSYFWFFFYRRSGIEEECRGIGSMGAMGALAPINISDLISLNLNY